jgi:hypothetical protein
MSSSARPAAVALSTPRSSLGHRGPRAPGGLLGRPASREPMTTGTPARPRRTARPKPRAPEPPMIETGSGTAADHMGRSPPTVPRPRGTVAPWASRATSRRCVRDRARLGRAGERAAAALVAAACARSARRRPRPRPTATSPRTPGRTRCTSPPGCAGAAAPLAALASLELEASGRRSGLRGCCRAARGERGRAHPAAGPRRATLVLTAHLDAAQTGLVWHPALARAAGARGACGRDRWIPSWRRSRRRSGSPPCRAGGP